MLHSLNTSSTTPGWTPYSSAISVSAEGVHSLLYRSHDNADNVEAANALTVRIDRAAPTLMFGTPSPAPNANGWSNTYVTIPCTPADALSGVASVRPVCPLVLTAEGAAVTGTVTVTDVAGNVASFTSPAVKIDRAPPQTAAVANPPANSAGWNNTNVAVTLSGSDSLSGVDHTECNLDAAGCTAYAGLVAITTEGMHTLQYRSVDKAGNVEAAQQLVVKLDKTAPVTVASPNPPPNAAGWNNQASVAVTLTATDNLSGVAKTEFNLDGAGWTPYTAPISVSTEGKHALQYRSVDLAGNVETAHQLTVNIDRTPPTVSCATTPNVLLPPDHKLVFVNAAVSVTDGLSGSAGFVLTSVVSNDPDQGLGDGDTPNDIQGWAVGTSSTSGQLRAERSGTGTGRVYTLTYTGADHAGNTATCAAPVTAPHDKSPSTRPDMLSLRH